MRYKVDILRLTVKNFRWSQFFWGKEIVKFKVWEKSKFQDEDDISALNNFGFDLKNST